MLSSAEMARWDPPSEDLLTRFGLTGERLEPLPGDASSRRYARVLHPEFGPCLLLLDQPRTPHFENFVAVGRHLFALGFSAPAIHAVELRLGAALIEDLGTATYTSRLAAGDDETMLYDLAVDTLVALHSEPEATAVALQPYDDERLLAEVELFADWFAPVLRSDVPADFTARHRALWSAALAPVAGRREALVLRDFHVDNLMLLPDREGVARCGLLDFQDALIGVAAYDLVSLTQDARRDVPTELEARCLARYLDARPEIGRDAFLAEYHLLAAQRHAKVAGIFHRLDKRDGKPAYLAHVPRVLRLLNAGLRNAGLGEISAFYGRWLPGWSEWRP